MQQNYHLKNRLECEISNNFRTVSCILYVIMLDTSPIQLFHEQDSYGQISVNKSIKMS